MNHALYTNNNNPSSHAPFPTGSPFGQNGTPTSINPAVTLNNINPNALDFSQLQNPLFQQQQQQQQQRNQSPGFANPGYNVNAIVPAKRPRPGEDNVGASPQPGSGPQGASRSQTPQHPAPLNAFQGGHHASPAPNPYQHLQPSSTHGSPSPGPHGQQQFSHPGQPPVTLANSPQPFLGQNPNFANFAQMQNRPGGPNAPMNPGMYMRSMPGQENNIGANIGPGGAAVGGGPTGQFSGRQGPQTASPTAQFQDAQRQYRMQMQRAQHQVPQQLPTNAGGLPQAQGMAPMSNPGMPAANGQGPNRPVQAQGQGQTPAQGKQAPEQAFMKSLYNFLAQRGQSLEREPRISGRPINYYQLFMLVSKHGIMMAGPNQGNWSLVASSLGFPPNEFPTAGEEAKGIFQRNLVGFAQTWTQIMQRRRLQQLQQQQQQGVQQQGQPPQGQPQAQSQQAQQQAAQQQMLQQQMQQVAQQQQQAPQHSPAPNQMQQGTMAGRSAQITKSQGQQPSSTPSTQQPSHPMPAQSMHSQAQAGTPVQASSASPAQINGAFNPPPKQPPFPEQNLAGHQGVGSVPQPAMSPMKTPPQFQQGSPPGSSGRHDLFSPQATSKPDSTNQTRAEDSKDSVDMYVPKKRLFNAPGETECWGGLPVNSLSEFGETLARLKPGVPIFEEMGSVDIHAITMSIQSGIHAEQRYALDQLVGISHDPRVVIALQDCEELVEALLDCGEEQLEVLVNATKEVSDTISLTNFEEVSKEGWRETETLQPLQSMGSEDYRLDRTAERLIAVTTIIRNLSCPDSATNHDLLASPPCVGFVASVLRALGTRSKLLRNARNTQDVMKDFVTLLSNVSHRLELPSRDDALPILHFLVAFAPSPVPTLDPKTQRLTFTSYDPKRNQYLPSAIDALAKLLARDDPNRTYCKSIFLSESSHGLSSSTSPQRHSYNLLTRAFSLAIAPIPNRCLAFINADRGDLVHLSHLRNPFFSQGMLAADILASLAPGHDNPLARSWLDSEDGWAPSLLNLLCRLGFDQNQAQPPARHPQTGRIMEDQVKSCNLITQRGLSMLRRLVEKAGRRDREPAREKDKDKDGDRGKGGVSSYGVLPMKETVLNALSLPNFDAATLKQLVALWALDG